MQVLQQFMEVTEVLRASADWTREQPYKAGRMSGFVQSVKKMAGVEARIPTPSQVESGTGKALHDFVRQVAELQVNRKKLHDSASEALCCCCACVGWRRGWRVCVCWLLRQEAVMRVLLSSEAVCQAELLGKSCGWHGGWGFAGREAVAGARGHAARDAEGQPGVCVRRRRGDRLRQGAAGLARRQRRGAPLRAAHSSNISVPHSAFCTARDWLGIASGLCMFALQLLHSAQLSCTS